MPATITSSFVTLKTHGSTERVEVAKQRLLTLKAQEQAYPAVNLSHMPVHELENRNKIISWLSQLKTHAKFSNEFVCLATSIFDRSSADRGIKSARIDPILIACVSVCLASKIGESKHFRFQDIMTLTSGDFNLDQLLVTEQQVLSALNWRMNPPTLALYCCEYLNVIDASDQCHEEMFKVLEPAIEKALKSHILLMEPQPDLSYAIFLNAFDELFSNQPELFKPNDREQLQQLVQTQLGLRSKSIQMKDLKALVSLCTSQTP